MLIDPKRVMSASPSLLIASLSAASTELFTAELTIGLPTPLAAVPDPRARRGIRHGLAALCTAAVRAVVAGYRSYTAIGEWVADLPVGTAVLLGIDPDRRPSEAMIRILLQALDAGLLTVAIGARLASRVTPPAPGSRQAIAVDGKTLAAHALAPVPPGTVLAAPNSAHRHRARHHRVGTKTNEIARFAAQLDQLDDLHGIVVTATPCTASVTTSPPAPNTAPTDPHRQRQPGQSCTSNWLACPGGLVPDADRHADCGQCRREIRTLKILSVSTGIDFPTPPR